MYEPYAVTVLTTEERCDFFRAAIGEKADFRFDPYDAMPLHLFLSNIALSAGNAVVLDEDYFLSTDSMVRGLRDFLDDAARSARELRLVLVCSHRKPGDALLRHVVSYFGIYDVVYDCTVRDAAHEAARMLASPNRRVDVLELFRGASPGADLPAALSLDSPAASAPDGAAAFGRGGLGAHGVGVREAGEPGTGGPEMGAPGTGAPGMDALGMDAPGADARAGHAEGDGGLAAAAGSGFSIERDGFRVDISLNITPIV